MSENFKIREVSQMREQTIQAIETVKQLLKEHIAQVENLEMRLARLEKLLTPNDLKEGQ
jgi:hypothetical protein